jgi:uncharacterized membrane protein HdeD (DUF308 family)
MTSTYTADVPRSAGPMLHALAQNWWLFLLRGLCAIVFGVLAFIWPGATLLTLVLLYGGFALVDGVASIIIAIRGEPLTSRWWLAIIGGLGIAAGILTLCWPGLTALVLLLFIAVWAIATGVTQIIGGIRLRKEIDNEWLPIVSGVLSVLFGLLLLVRPGAGALAMIFVIGTYAIVQGILMVAFSWRLRWHAHAANRS